MSDRNVIHRKNNIIYYHSKINTIYFFIIIFSFDTVTWANVIII